MNIKLAEMKREKLEKSQNSLDKSLKTVIEALEGN
jgi:hypothetical protein